MAVQACATARRCLDLTLDWVRNRETFGRPLASRQVIRHRVAEMARRADVARILGIGGGTNEIMNEIIAKRLALT
jgi:acyl-CoA dehydrogenase